MAGVIVDSGHNTPLMRLFRALRWLRARGWISRPLYLWCLDRWCHLYEWRRRCAAG